MPAASLLLYAGVLAALAILLDDGRIARDEALLWLAGASVVAGALYLIGLFQAQRLSIAIPSGWLIGVAVAARLIVGGGPPMLESDYQRYFWDGAVVVHGINPYRYAPDEVAAGAYEGPGAMRLRSLAVDAGPVLPSINHPRLTTIYPPVAQVGFALAYLVEPFGVTGWRIVLCLADAVTALLLVRLLRELSLPAMQIAWFVWNPLLLHEVYSALHMDMLVLPLLAGAVLAGVRSRSVVGSVLCVVGSAVKVWPILLTPLLLRPLVGRWRWLVAAVASCIALLGALWLPVLLTPHGPDSGFFAYARGWQNNDGFFRAGIWLTERGLDLIHVAPWHSHTIMRAVSAGLVLGVLLRQAGKAPDARDLPRRCLLVVGAVFLLSPTQFPWYWLWCLPLLTVRPSLPLLLYAALLPLYYLQDRTQMVYWVEHVPVWGLIAVAAARAVGRGGANRGGDPEVSGAP